MRSPLLQHFETFLAVANRGGFTAAARQLGVSKVAVSNSIRQLEDSLQVPLFIRSTRQVSLTEEGQLLLKQCERLKRELNTAEEIVSGFNQNPSGTLRINCNLHFSENWLADILSRYVECFPDVRIEVLSDERMPNMLQEQIDIIFGVNWPAPPDVVARTIGKTRYILCASPEYLKKNGVPASIKALANYHYIPHLGRKSDNLIANLKKKESISIVSKLAANNAHFMKTCALKGLGVVQLHDYMVQEEIESGQLVEILPETAGEPIPVSIYYQKHRFVQPKIRQFVNLLLEGGGF